MIYLNGKFIESQDAKIESNDRGFLLSDGLFETMRSYGGRVFQLKQHWERLKKGAEFLEIPITITFTDLESIIRSLLEKNTLSDKDASLRLTVTRGTGPRGLLPPKEPKPTILLAAFELQPHVTPSVKIYISSIGRNERSPLANIKSLSYLDNILARREAVKNDADEAILLNSKGYVAEASAANIFMVSHDGEVMTPRLEDGALPGITRQVVIELCKQLNIVISEISISPEKLMEAKEIFLTNSLIEIQSVLSINNLVINCEVGNVTRKLHEAYNAKIKKVSLITDNQFGGRLFTADNISSTDQAKVTKTNERTGLTI
jgi:branched-chain amino acid aminotransferase